MTVQPYGQRTYARREAATIRVTPHFRERLYRRDFVPVLIFWLLGIYPYVLLLTWAVSAYLTFIEARQQHLDGRRTLWWLLLVFFLHFLGYIALRVWVFYKRHRAAV